MNIPVVNLERGGDDDTISVQCDNYQGGKLAAEHLIECGCKNLLHFGGVAGKDTFFFICPILFFWQTFCIEEL